MNIHALQWFIGHRDVNNGLSHITHSQNTMRSGDNTGRKCKIPVAGDTLIEVMEPGYDSLSHEWDINLSSSQGPLTMKIHTVDKLVKNRKPGCPCSNK